MRKFRLMFDKEKEVEWLNEMVQDGYAMDGFFAGLYHFSPCEKGKWQYQIDIGQGFGRVNASYREFMEEMGVEIVQCWGPWVVLRREAAEGPFELYSDVDGQIEQQKKVLLLFKIATGIELLGAIYCLWAGCNGVGIGFAFAFLIAALAVILGNRVIRTKKILHDLHERKGETPKAYRGRPMSLLLSAGLGLNAAHLLAATSDVIEIPTAIRIVLLLISIVLMIAGIVQTKRAQSL